MEPTPNKYVELIFAYAITNGIDLTQLKLQKVLYYLQAWNIAYFQDQLFNELPKAWVNGPVYTSVYEEFRKFGSESLLSLEQSQAFSDGSKLNQTLQQLKKNEDGEGLIVAILEKYMAKSVGELVYQTHLEKPWIEARRGLSAFEPGATEISFTSMMTFYGGVLERAALVKLGTA